MVVLRRTESFVWVKLSMFTPSWPLPRQLWWSPWALPWWSPLFTVLFVSAPRLLFLPLSTSMLVAFCIWHAVPFSPLRVAQTLDCCSDRKKVWWNCAVSVIFPRRYFHQPVVRDWFCPAAFDLLHFLIVLTPDCQY